MMLRTQSSFADPFLFPVLSPSHHDYFTSRAVSLEVAKAAGVASVSRSTIEALTSVRAKSDGILFPYLPEGPGDYGRVRLDLPIPLKDGSTMRYATPKGERVRPYLPNPRVTPSFVWDETSLDLYLWESPTKCLAGVCAGYHGVGLGGVSTGHDSHLWQTKRELRLHPELRRRIVWTGRIVYVVFDANRATNKFVLEAERRLCQALANAGAIVFIVFIPLTEEGKDQGPDDFLARHGKEAFARLVEAAKPWLSVHKPIKDMPRRYREQFEVLEKRSLRLIVTSLEDARRVALQAEQHARKTYGQLTLCRLPTSAGKSHGILLDAPLYEEPTVLHTPTHDLSRELYHRATELQIKARRHAAGCSPRGFVDVGGNSLCLQNLEDILGEIAAGKTCASCPYFEKECPFGKGFEGDENARMLFAVHDAPLPVGFPCIDEKLSLSKKHTITEADLLALLQDTTIAPYQLSVLVWAAQCLLLAIEQGAETDPLNEKIRQALLEVAPLDKAGRPVAQVVRHGVVMGNSSSPGRQAGTRSAWSAGVWLLRAALKGSAVKVKDCVARDEKRRPVAGAVFETSSPLIGRLKEANRGFLVDATATEADAMALAKATGLEVRFVAIEVVPQVQVTRRWVPHLRACRETLLGHGRIDLSTLTRLVQLTVVELKRVPWVKALLLASYLPVAKKLREWWEMFCRKREPLLEELPYLKAVAPLFGLIQAREGSLDVLHFGALRGKDGHKAADGAISWGSPYGPVEEEGEEAFAQNREVAAAELAQFFGRLRLLVRSTPAFLLCVGDVVPSDWKVGEFTLRYTPPGRPAQTTEGTEWKERLVRLLEAKGLRALARELGVDPKTLANYRDGKRQPTPELEARLVTLGEVLGVDEIAKATPPSLEESEKEPLNVLSNFVHTREIPKEATDVDGKTAKGLTIQTTECTSWPEGTAFP